MIEIEIFGDFLLDDVPDIDERGIEVSLATGFGGEHFIRIVIGAKDFFKKAKTVALKMLNYERVTGVKITKDKIEIGSMNSSDTEKIKQFVVDVLAKVQKSPAPVKVRSKAKKAAKRR